MNNEQQTLYSEIETLIIRWKNYIFNSEWTPISTSNGNIIGKKSDSDETMTQEIFINRIKTDDEFAKKWDEVNIYKQNKQTLYSEIETLIIRWNIDGTKTAGSLTRDIMKLIENKNENK
jgi:hypothetical protein